MEVQILTTIKLDQVNSKSLIDAMLSFKKSKDKNYDFGKSHKELSNQNLNMRESGCISLDLAYVGAGRLDGVWGYDINILDIAAGALIAQRWSSYK